MSLSWTRLAKTVRRHEVPIAMKVRERSAKTIAAAGAVSMTRVVPTGHSSLKAVLGAETFSLNRTTAADCAATLPDETEMTNGAASEAFVPTIAEAPAAMHMRTTTAALAPTTFIVPLPRVIRSAPL